MRNDWARWGAWSRGRGLAILLMCACSSDDAPSGPDDSPDPDPPGPPTQMVAASGNGQAGVVGHELTSPIVVRLTDAVGRPTPNRIVTFAVTSGAGSLFVSTSATDADGRAANRWTLGTVLAGEHVVEARIVIPENGLGLIAEFTAVPTADAPVSLAVASGDRQIGEPATALGVALGVLVQDQYQNPAEGVTVSWTVVDGGGALTPATSDSDGDGIASASWTLGPLEGVPQRASASFGDLSVEFTARFLDDALFTEDFETGLDGWSGRNGGNHDGQIVADPHNAGNKVLNFTRTVAAGNIFSEEISVDPAATYVLEFDYLGVPGAGSIAGDLGGYIGVSDSRPGSHFWLGGTDPAQATQHIVDDGQWHTYQVQFVPSAVVNFSDGTIRIMLEDGAVSIGVPGDAYFDNVSLRPASQGN